MTIELVGGRPTTTSDFRISQEEFDEVEVGSTIHGATVMTKKPAKVAVDLCYSASPANCAECKTKCPVAQIVS